MSNDTKSEDDRPLGRHADQTIRRMIREEIDREKAGKPIKPYPSKEGGLDG